MADYISRDDALNAINKMRIGLRAQGAYEFDIIAAEAKSRIDALPAADVRPVVRAVWRRYSPFTDTYECSNCGEQVIDQQFRTNFCPNCGAMMEES